MGEELKFQSHSLGGFIFNFGSVMAAMKVPSFVLETRDGG